MVDGHRTADLRVVAPPGDVLRDVGATILRGRVRPGAAAPTESELSTSLRVSRASAARALTALEAVGLLAPDEDAVSTRRVLAGTSTDDIGRLLRFLLADDSAAGPSDLIEVRTTLERDAVAGAARGAAEADLADLDAIVDQMQDPRIDEAAFERLDREFHLRIARASGNALHEPLLLGMGDAIASQMGRAFSAAPNWRLTARRLASEHRHLIGFIGNRCASAAADYVETHVKDFYATT